MQMLYKMLCLIKSKLLQNNYNRSWSYAILQFCIPYRKNYEYNMSRGINWMYYAYMSLRVLLHYGTEIFLKYTYIFQVYIFFIYYWHFCLTIRRT